MEYHAETERRWRYRIFPVVYRMMHIRAVRQAKSDIHFIWTLRPVNRPSGGGPNRPGLLMSRGRLPDHGDRWEKWMHRMGAAKCA